MAEKDQNELPFEEVEEVVNETNPQKEQRPTDSEHQEMSIEELQASLEQIESLAQLDPSIRETPEYKKVLEGLKNAGTKKENKDVDEEEIEFETTDEAIEYYENMLDEYDEDSDEYIYAKTMIDELQKEEDDDEEENNDDKDISDPFGITKSKPKQKVDVDVNEEFKKFIEEKYAIKDVDTFVNSVDKWRNDSQNLTKLTEEVEELNEGLQNLPQPIKDAITAYANAEDYIEAFNKNSVRLNYDLDFEEQDKEKVVQHYFSDKHKKIVDKYNEGDIDEDDYNDRINDLYDSAKRLYEVDRQSFEKQRAEYVERQENYLKNLRESAISSVNFLKKEYPDFSQKDLQRVKQRLVDGNLEELFVNKDGTYKENAAEMLALALYGKDVIKVLTEKAKIRGKSEANEEIVNRSNKKVKTKKSSGKPTNTEALNAISHLSSQFEQDPYV